MPKTQEPFGSLNFCSLSADPSRSSNRLVRLRSMFSFQGAIAHDSRAGNTADSNILYQHPKRKSTASFFQTCLSACLNRPLRLHFGRPCCGRKYNLSRIRPSWQYTKFYNQMRRATHRSMPRKSAIDVFRCYRHGSFDTHPKKPFDDPM